MTQAPERPDPAQYNLKRRRAPTPAADEKIDPVDYPTPDTTPPEAPAQPQPATSQRRTRRDRGLPFSTRLAEDVINRLEDQVDQRGITLRAAVEEAVRAYYGKPSTDPNH